MILACDIGNTTIVVCEYSNKIINSFKIDTINAFNYFKLKKEFDKKLLNRKFDDIIISSVVPSINKIISKVFLKLLNTTPLFIDVSMKHDLKISIDNPLELGSDLLTALVGAGNLEYDNICIVDLGTATKMLVLKNKEFLGGVIIPGLMTSLNSLFDNAELLTEVPLGKPFRTIGTSTYECIRNGSILGTTSMIEKLVEKMETEVGPLKVVLTGGNASFIKDSLKIPFIYLPDLVIDGIIKMYEMNQ